MSKSKYKQTYDVVIRFRCKTTKDYATSKLSSVLKDNMNLVAGNDILFDGEFNESVRYEGFNVSAKKVEHAG